MAQIDILVTGNGTAYVDNPTPNIGDTVTLYCDPATGETLLDVLAWDEGGHSIALAVTPVQSFTWNFVAMTISVVFSGTTPPQPTTPNKIHRMPIWEYPCLSP